MAAPFDLPEITNLWGGVIGGALLGFAYLYRMVKGSSEAGLTKAEWNRHMDDDTKRFDDIQDHLHSLHVQVELLRREIDDTRKELKQDFEMSINRVIVLIQATERKRG